MKYSFDQSVIVAVLMALLLVSLAGLSLIGIGDLVNTADWVEHTQLVIDRLQTLLTDVEEQSMTKRSFVRTGNPTYQQSFQDIRQDVPAQLEALKELTSDNPARQSDLAQLHGLLDQQMAALDRLGQPGENGQAPSIVQQIDESNRFIDQIKARIISMQAGERLLLQQRTANAQRSSTLVKSVIIAGSLIGLIALLVNTLSLRREMTMRERMEETLRQSEQRARLMIDSIKDYAIIMLDTAGKVVSWNSGAERIKGYRAEEIIGQHFSRFYPEEKIRVDFPEKELQMATDEGRFEDEGWRVRKDGSRFWASVVISAVRNSQDELLGFVKITRDLTERRRAEQALRKSQQTFEGLFENSPDAIVLVDHSGYIVRVNAQVDALFGYSHAELQGRSVETLIPERHRLSHGAHLAAYFAAPRARAMGAGLELFARRKDGTEFPVDIMLSPLDTDEGIRALAVIRDITVRKESQQRIENLNKELKQRASMLEVANKELEAFSYSVSHDLRAPLRHIHGFVDMLQKAPAFREDESSRRHMTIIAKAAKQMGVLIDDLLDFSRTGRAEMRPVQVNMREMIDQIIRDREMECRERNVTWEIKPLPKVTGDPNLLRLVWVNLLDNAIKYTQPRQEAKIEIGQAAPDCPGSVAGEAVFYVRDNGVGFDMQYSSKLFGVFQRLHRPEDFEGTGIGLANVQRIIHRHGGRVWAEAKVDSGATFYFSLPVTTTV